jgi:hypothetical protein
MNYNSLLDMYDTLGEVLDSCRSCRGVVDHIPEQELSRIEDQLKQLVNDLDYAVGNAHASYVKPDV